MSEIDQSLDSIMASRTVTQDDGRSGGARRGGGRGPYSRSGVDNSSLGDDGITVKPASVPRKVAGAIAGRIREGNYPTVGAVGTNALNVAIKSIALARKYLLNDSIDIVVRPSFDPSDKIDYGFLLCTEPKRKTCPTDANGDFIEPPNATALTVAKKSDPQVVAGAIASNAREQNRCYTSSLGPVCVTKAIHAIIKAREYLEDREDELDLAFAPQIKEVELESNNGEMCVTNSIINIVYVTSVGGSV